jgi:AraC family transcriptional regulator
VLDPQQVLGIIPHEPVASSRERRWQGATVHVFRDQGPTDIHAEGFSHHLLIMRTQRSVSVWQRRGGHEQSTPAGPGRLELVPAGMQNEWRWTEPLSATHLHLDPLLVFGYIEQAGGDPASCAVRPAFSVDDPILRRHLCALQAVTESGHGVTLYAEALARGVAARVASGYVDSGGYTIEGPRRLSPRQLHLVFDYIDAHLGGNLSLGDLAGVAGISSFHFARLFKTSTGETPHRAVVRLRVHRARRLIESGLSLADVASAVGFSDQSHLHLHYKRAFGETPGQTRRSLR